MTRTRVLPQDACVPRGSALKCLTQNCDARPDQRPERSAALLRELRAADADLVALQEVVSVDSLRRVASTDVV